LPQTDLRAPLRAEEGAAALGLNLSSPARPRELVEVSAAPRTQPSVAARFELVQQMGERIRLLHHQGAQEVRVSLNPAHLGQVDIHLTRHEGHYSLHMIAETPLAKELLESQLGQLKQHLGQQGLLLDQASVDLGGQPEQGQQSAKEQAVNARAAGVFKLFPEADDIQEDGVSVALPAPDSAVNYLA
jgi:flagellar hook-length control protein FliK